MAIDPGQLERDLEALPENLKYSVSLFNWTAKVCPQIAKPPAAASYHSEADDMMEWAVAQPFNRQHKDSYLPSTTKA